MYFLAAASSASVGPSSAIRRTTSRMTASVSAARSERVAVLITRPDAYSCVTSEESDAVGQPALFAHLVEQPRRERAASQYVVHQVGGEEVRRVAGNAGIGELQRRLRQVVVDPHFLAEFQVDLLDRLQAGFLRQVAEQPVELALDRLRIDRADDRHMQIVAREDRLVVGAQIVGRDRGQRLLGALVGPRIGMVAVERLRPFDPRRRFGIARIGDDARHHLRADAVDRRGVEARLLDRQPAAGRTPRPCFSASMRIEP